jgi:hypothetical protein
MVRKSLGLPKMRPAWAIVLYSIGDSRLRGETILLLGSMIWAWKVGVWKKLGSMLCEGS